MITVTKLGKVPLTLRRTGKLANDLNEQAYLSDSAYSRGEVDFDIKSSIYGYKTVKKRLREAQFNKCCFCEKEQSDEFAAVEHYRPWGGYKSAKTDELVKPGYYWLGYSWSNLYFVCSACNTYKANYFPLVDEQHRASSHLHHVDRETPLLLDPAGPLNPLDHLTFDFQFIRSLSPHGDATIEICRLNRPELNEKRKLLTEILKAYVAIYQAPTSEIITVELQQEAVDFLRSSQEPTGEFSSVAIAYLKRRNVQLN